MLTYGLSWEDIELIQQWLEGQGVPRRYDLNHEQWMTNVLHMRYEWMRAGGSLPPTAAQALFLKRKYDDRRETKHRPGAGYLPHR